MHKASKRIELELLLNLYDIDICMIAETYLKEHHNFNLSGYKIYRNDRTSHAGGVALAIKANIPHKTIEIGAIRSIENISIQINCLGKSIILTTAYSPKYTKNFTADLLNLMPDNHEFLILGDFNAF